MLGTAIEVIGWLGALSVAAAYMLFSMNRLSNGYVFQTANLTGAVAMVLHGAYHSAWPSATVNIIWGSIAGCALIRLKLLRLRAAPATPVAADPTEENFPAEAGSRENQPRAETHP